MERADRAGQRFAPGFQIPGSWPGDARCGVARDL